MKIICKHISKHFFNPSQKSPSFSPREEGILSSAREGASAFGSRDSTSNNNLKVLEDITVETEDNDFVCIFGPNGCGKTTLLKIIAGILTPSNGNIEYAGEKSYLHPVTLVFQEQGLFPWLNVIDNICFGLEMSGSSKKERYKKAKEYIEQFGLNKFVSYYPYQLSMGMKQKVSLIRGLLMDSEVLLIDESDISLDIYSKFILQRDIHKIWSEYKKTIIYVTHDIEGAIRLAKHIWIMSGLPGRIIARFNVGSGEIDHRRKENIHNQLFDLENKIREIIKEEAHKGL